MESIHSRRTIVWITGAARAGRRERPLTKLVVDTNLFVAAYFNQGSASARILERAREGRVELLWTDAVREEAVKVLRAMPIADAYVEGVEGLFRPACRVEPAPAPEVPGNPDDTKFVACALGGRADMIVSNDRDLLEAPDTAGVQVCTPQDALARLPA